MKKIFVIEDDEEISGLLEFNLKKQGYNVVSDADGREALNRLQEEKPDLILLDIMLPELDGYEVCRVIRTWDEFKKTPIIMLTAKSDEFDVVLGLELGADDYVIKPFSVRELLSRIKAHLRRNEDSPRNGLPQEEQNIDTTLEIGEVTLKAAEYQVSVRGKQVNLTHKEFELLKLLMNNKGRVLKRDLLLEKIWGYDTDIDTRTVDVHVRYLRQKIEEDPANPRYIKTTRGVGYFLDSNC